MAALAQDDLVRRGTTTLQNSTLRLTKEARDHREALLTLEPTPPGRKSGRRLLYGCIEGRRRPFG
jgi:hypothetical protein